MGWVYASERLSLSCLGKASRGKAKAKTGIGKSDLPGLQGGPRKRDFVLGQSARASALSRLCADYPVGAVVISGDGAGDQTVGSLDVNALEGWT